MCCSVLIINFGTIVSFAFFPDHVLVPRDGERRKSTEHELEPNLVKNFLSILIYSLPLTTLKALSHVSSCSLLSSLSPKISLSVFFFISSIHQNIKYIFMYKAMQSMLMKTSAPSFSHAFLFFALLYAFFPFYIFCITTITPKKIIFFSIREKSFPRSRISVKKMQLTWKDFVSCADLKIFYKIL